MVQATSHIDTHIRTYRSLLKSAGVVKISQLEASHTAMRSVLHEYAHTDKIDAAAFVYALLRLPIAIPHVKTVILGQSYGVFRKNGVKIARWKQVEAPGRRRKMAFNGKDTLAVYIASVTDVDDIVTLLTAYQIEWNKMHVALASYKDVEKGIRTLFPPSDLARIQAIVGKDFPKFLRDVKKRQLNVEVKLLSGSYVEYAKATQRWWDHVDLVVRQLQLSHRPIYFVSSNTHSLVNVLTRFVREEEEELTKFLYASKNDQLIQLWEQIERGEYKGNRENFLYYLSKKYAITNPSMLTRKLAKETSLGIHTIKPSHYLDITVQIIEMNKLHGIKLDERLEVNLSHLAHSDAVIINVDYPLGWAAYQILIEIGQNIESLRGMYIMGKSATQNGNIGDILIPNTVFDQHTKNVYAINNCFSQKDFTHIFKTGAVLDSQKTVAVKGTFFENTQLLGEWYRKGYTIVEMETGPYLNAAYEFVYYNRYEENEVVNLKTTPFELGIVHYASDTPNSKAANLGVRNLSYEGVEATYGISLAIVKKIVEQEKKFT